MKIQDIHIQNFRGIHNLHISKIDSRMNIIVGVNGAGKTSFLDALSILLSWVIARMKSASAKGSAPKDSDVSLDSKESCSLSVTIENGVSWSIQKFRAFSSRNASFKTDLGQMSAFAEKIVQGVDHGGNVPIIMYYPVERAIASAPVNLHRSEPTIWDVYKDALSGNANFRSLFEWYRRQEDLENELIRDDASYRDRSLDCVRRAIGSFFPDFSELRVRRRPRQAMVVRKGEEVIEFTQLSQGEKCYLSLICDIARRLAIANPGLENPLYGEGIVLVDEIDLHLHPKWQSEIVPKLMDAFPNCQFFLSTHSSIVLSDLKKSQIIPISGGDKVDISFDPYGKLSSQIMTNYFDTPRQRNLTVANDIDEAFDALRNKDTEKFNKLFDKLLPIIGASDADMVNLRIEAKRRGMV
mgnify:FL=1